MNNTTKYLKNSWTDRKSGGLVLRADRSHWLARPPGQVGMSSIQGFSNQKEAEEYADSRI